MSLQCDQDLRRTICAGHEEYFDFECDSCSIENHHIKATGHCINCIQNICNDCIKSHKKLAGLRSHVLENKPKVISGKGAQANTSSTDPLIDHCSTHPDELIKFNCNIHKTLACVDCLALNHRTCEDVVNIRYISGNIVNSEELNTLQSGLRRLEVALAKYKTDSDRIQTDFTERYASIVKEIKQWRTDIDKVLNELEEKLLEEASSIRMDTMSCLTNNSSSCDDLIIETKKLVSELDDKIKSGHYNSLYITVKQNKETLVKLQQEAALIEEQSKPRQLSFQRHENVATFLSSLGLGTVYLSGEPDNIQAKHECDINVKSSTDKQDCIILGATVLPDGRLCLCDWKNKYIKIVDTKQMKITEQLTLYAEPRDATMISQNELAVTIDDKALQIVSISPTLRPSRTIRLPDIYRGITYCDDKFLLTCWYSKDNYDYIDICDMAGNRIKRIETNVDGTKIFTGPCRICVSPDLSMMYVTDKERHTVVCMNMDGDVINVYRNEILKAPYGITVDQDGNVYVCSRHTHNIHQLTPTGQLVQILLDQKDGLQYPAAITYKSGQLCISNNSADPAYRNNIKVFRLTQKW